MNTKCAALIALSITLLPTGAARATETSAAAHRPTVSDAPQAARQLLDLVNQERKSAGLVPLAPRNDVTAIATPWTRHMAADGWLSHNESYFSRPTMERIGAACTGENVAWATSLIEVHEVLMASPRHRENILNADFRQVGIAVVHTTDDKLYVTEDFMAPRVPPAPTPPSSRAHRTAPRPRPRGPVRFSPTSGTHARRRAAPPGPA